MVRLLNVFIILIFITSCGARKKNTSSSKEKLEIETTDIINTNIKNNNDIITNSNTITNSKGLRINVVPLIIDSTKGTNEITLIDEHGKQTKIQYPKNSSVNFDTESKEENKTENKEDKSKTEVNLDKKNDTKIKGGKDKSDMNLDRAEPKVFNFTMALIIGGIIILVFIIIFIIYKAIKHNTKVL